MANDGANSHCHVNDSMESLVGHWLSQLDDPLINPLFVSLYSDARCRSAVRLHPSRRIRTSAPSAEPWWPRRSSSRISWPKSLQVSRTILLQLSSPPRRACVCTIPAVDRPSSSPPLPPISAVAGAFFCSSILVLVGRFSPTMAFIDNSWESLVGSLLSSASLAFDLLLRGCSLVPPCVYDSSSLILASSPSPTSPLLLCMSGLNFPPLRSAECRAPGGRLSIVSAQRRLMDQCQPFSS